VRHLYLESKAERWGLDRDRFAAALERSLARACSPPDRPEHAPAKIATGLHLEDLALACACAEGSDAAWEAFIREQRPALYRAADALDPSGGAREIADSLFADLFGVDERDGERRSLLVYYHGRSSLATWLRAVLAQRIVDRARSSKRLEPLGDEPVAASSGPPPDPSRGRYLALLRNTLAMAVRQLAGRDRLRLAYYYREQLTLAQTGRVLGEHEATVSRQLTRTRKALRLAVEERLRAGGLSPDEVAACFVAVTDDVGPLDLDELFGAPERKNFRGERSPEREST
jgi:RNA polymerase sigma-70 factor (ECF subfamily)